MRVRKYERDFSQKKALPPVLCLRDFVAEFNIKFSVHAIDQRIRIATTPPKRSDLAANNRAYYFRTSLIRWAMLEGFFDEANKCGAAVAKHDLRKQEGWDG